ncbi:MAG: hypothetical protein H7Y18_03255 [Clostridiaceae bacterium]|nr:hypothetical protein [Clostridiaceae bacterium]
MQMFGWNNNSGGIPFYTGIDYGKDEGIINHDSYEVYVNGDYVGNKSLLAQGEEISDIDKHLQLEGFRTFDEEVMGNHVDINTNDLEEARRIKQNLNVYLRIR